MTLLSLNQAGVSPRLLPVTTCVEQGQMIHILGPNGSGKSTLLTMLAGLIPYQGDIDYLQRPLAGWALPALARSRAWLHQQQLPSGQLSVWHFLAQHRVGETDVETVVADVCRCLALTDKLGKSVNQLSGGEWQRVRLAGVLIQIDPAVNRDARMLLLDEPLTGLDVAQQHALEKQLKTLCEKGISVVMSSHDLNHSLQQADKVWLLQSGRLVAQGSAQEILQPAQLAATFGVTFQRFSLPEGDFLLRKN
ncbi:vitamin B12 ABC transporter ATP-binding protein BtuD [Enterobacterales bacterium CwR94]|nr:vitamin B12 ABC transporter ATP-binding protein BtuD [Enterobacterales bacterium CwR94]